jgi:two-component system, OmpR family, flagellar system response regulator FtcR
MYVVVDSRPIVTDGFAATFGREGFAAQGFDGEGFGEWLRTASEEDLGAVEGFMLGEFDGRKTFAARIRNRSPAPIIAISEDRSLEQTIELFTAGIDDVVRKPVHVKELVVRADAVRRRGNINHRSSQSSGDEIVVYFDGRDPEVKGEPLRLPRRERHILEYLARNKQRRLTKTQIFSAVYGIFDDVTEEIVVEGHISKLRKKIRLRLGRDAIDSKRFLGYQFVG